MFFFSHQKSSKTKLITLIINKIKAWLSLPSYKFHMLLGTHTLGTPSGSASYTVFTNGGHAGKKLVPSHESEALEDKQKLQMKTFSELAECLARIPPKITLYGLLFKYNDVGCLLLLMFSTDLLFAIKRDSYIFKETG